jgi:hypothetical protein
MTLLSRVRPGSAVRGAGVGLACVLPGLTGRARAVAASHAVGWALDKPGLQLLIVVPDEDEDAWKRLVLPVVTSGLSWTAAMLLAVSAARRSALPAPVAALLLGGAVAVGDTALIGVGERAKARVSAVSARE